MNTSLENVRAKIIEAVPDIKNAAYFPGIPEYRPITLADVLRAIESLDGPEIAVNNEGQFFVFIGAGNGERSDSWEGTTTVWNLALPLDDQEPEVIEFLERILNARTVEKE